MQFQLKLGFVLLLTQLLLTLTPSLACQDWKGLQALPQLSC